MEKGSSAGTVVTLSCLTPKIICGNGLVRAARVDNHFRLALEFRSPFCRWSIALGIPRGIEYLRDRSVSFFGIQQPLKALSKELTPCFTDFSVANAFCCSRTFAAAHFDWIFAAPNR